VTIYQIQRSLFAFLQAAGAAQWCGIKSLLPALLWVAPSRGPWWCDGRGRVCRRYLRSAGAAVAAASPPALRRSGKEEKGREERMGGLL